MDVRLMGVGNRMRPVLLSYSPDTASPAKTAEEIMMSRPTKLRLELTKDLGSSGKPSPEASGTR